MKKRFKPESSKFINNVEKLQNAFLSLEDYHYDILDNVNALFGSKNIENQQIKPAKYTVLMLRVRQNERKKAFGRSPTYQ